MKKIIKKIIKKLLNAGEKETVSDSLQKKKYSFFKKINKKKFGVKDIKVILSTLGLKSGDTVIVHCAWRSFIGFEGSPQDIIDMIKSIIGPSGTILMPAFTSNFDVFKYDDRSDAGVLSEIFRKMNGVQRSLNSVFSMCAYGRLANYYLKDHLKSEYCFDDNSPYYKAIENNAKVLLLGLGKNPHKITLFHCVSYSLKDKVEYYKNVYSLEKNVKIFDKNNKKISKIIIDRQPNFQNSKRKFKKLFKKFIKNRNYKKINFVDIYLFETKELFNNVYDFILNNNFEIYK